MSAETVLASNIHPVMLDKMERFSQVFIENADRKVSDLIKISVGFISVDSIMMLREYIRSRSIKAVELTVGMHAFSLFTRPQYKAVTLLDEELRSRTAGQVNICTAFPFHGKVYTFWKQGHPHYGIIGSSNLDSILAGGHHDYEVDLMFDDIQTLRKTALLQKELSEKASRPLQDWTPEKFKLNPQFAADQPNVETLSLEKTSEYWSLAQQNSFLLKLKTEPKSNLNSFFAKGRENKKTKIIRPRPWYEVEVIVGADIVKQIGYPRKSEFEIVTKDGYKFECVTCGDYSKNFRSKHDLRILGMWIKGKMEEAGALQVGEPVTEAVLNRFGKKSIKLTATNDPKLWLAELV